MRVIIHPERSDWEKLLQRPVFDLLPLRAHVQAILDAVKTGGDAALREFSEKYDNVQLDDLAVSENTINAVASTVEQPLKSAILQAAENITAFHASQAQAHEIIETAPGIQCWRKNVGIEKVGLYIPGGTAPLFSTLLMLGIPARLAGCREVIVCSPPDENGSLHPAMLYAAQLAGISKIFRIGGAQAIAAMAYGTETVPQAYKIFGPGNQYVTCAKSLVQGDGVAIDMPAGPSELAIFADESAMPSFIAADLLSQAEHGADSQVILVSCSETLTTKVLEALNNQLAALPRKEVAAKALEHSVAIVLKSEADAFELLNAYAPEHLILACDNPRLQAERVINAGSVFLGHYAPESAGDYASGTNHTLPTNGHAKAYSGVSLDSFVKKITFQHLTPDGLSGISAAVQQMAFAEGLAGHARAVQIRMEEPGQQ